LALEAGVTILQPESVTIEYNVEIGKDTVIYPSTYIAANTRIGRNCQIGPFVYLRGVNIKDNEIIRFERREG
jgi:bifunctional UDP-N-acetylglucosamine pyrophosphorylase/glucosamine-1-phosphate N-acetyltransferase